MDLYVISLLAANFCYQLPGAQGFQISTNMETKRKYEEASVLAGKGYKSVTDCFDTPNIGVKGGSAVLRPCFESSIFEKHRCMEAAQYEVEASMIDGGDISDDKAPHRGPATVHRYTMTATL
jgi:hypothetical protein